MRQLFAKLLGREKRKKIIPQDFYQEQINKFGKEQLERLVEKSLNIPVGLLK